MLLTTASMFVVLKKNIDEWPVMTVILSLFWRDRSLKFATFILKIHGIISRKQKLIQTFSFTIRISSNANSTNYSTQ